VVDCARDSGLVVGCRGDCAGGGLCVCVWGVGGGCGVKIRKVHVRAQDEMLTTAEILVVPPKKTK